ncbi:hypothetical protein [Bradyrhizobium sp. JR3.5]
MRKRRACQAVARRLGLNVNRVAALVQRCSENGLLPVATGSARPNLTNIELARLLIAVIADNGLGNVPATVRDFSALEASGLRFDDWLEGVVAGRVNLAGVLSLAIQTKPQPAVSVITGSARLQFGEPTADTAKGLVISGDVLRSIVGDFNGVG